MICTWYVSCVLHVLCVLCRVCVVCVCGMIHVCVCGMCVFCMCVWCVWGGRWAHKRLYRRGGLKPGGMSLKEEVGKSCEDVLGASKLASAGRHGRSWVPKMKGFSRLAGIGPSCGKQGIMGHLRP